MASVDELRKNPLLFIQEHTNIELSECQKEAFRQLGKLSITAYFAAAPTPMGESFFYRLCREAMEDNARRQEERIRWERTRTDDFGGVSSWAEESAVVPDNWMSFRQRIEYRHEGLLQKRKDAYDKALGLLLVTLSSEQRRSFRQYGHFDVVGSNGGKYRIRERSSFNVEDLVSGDKLCAVPAYDMPLPDIMLSQMMWLETNEGYFLAMANIGDEIPF